MHSSISNFERAAIDRLTASDRPGVAQPVPVRDIPSKPWGRILLMAVAVFVMLLAGWEYYWRAYGATTSYRNSDGEWAQQRRRIDQGEGNKTVLVGSSRTLFDVQLPVWESITGERPIQLALEGTSPLPVLEDLAADPKFTGRLLVGVAPDMFFNGFAYRGSAIKYFHKQGPSERSGDWISANLVEPYFAFYDPDFALDTVVQRQDWPLRSGMHKDLLVRKLLVQDADRNSHMWRKIEVDSDYRTIVRNTWMQHFYLPGMDTPEKIQKGFDDQIARAVKAITTLHARGVPVLFIRPPSAGAYYAFEQKSLPRAQTWDLLLQRTGVPGIHFEDYPEMQGYDAPDWSHLSASEANRFTGVLVPIVEREFGKLKPRAELATH